MPKYRDQVDGPRNAIPACERRGGLLGPDMGTGLRWATSVCVIQVAKARFFSRSARAVRQQPEQAIVEHLRQNSDASKTPVANEARRTRRLPRGSYVFE